MKKFIEKLKNVPWYILLAIIIGIPVIIGISYILGFGASVIDLLGDIFLAVSGGNWVVGVLCTLCVLIGLINAIRGIFADLPEGFFKLPEWVQTLIMGISLVGTIMFIVIFFDKLV